MSHASAGVSLPPPGPLYGGACAHARCYAVAFEEVADRGVGAIGELDKLPQRAAGRVLLEHEGVSARAAPATAGSGGATDSGSG